MVKSKQYRRKPRAVRRKRFARRRPRLTNVNRSLQPIPARYICKMKYSENVTTDSNGHYVFNLNSVYDPNRTGIGHQPYGFDVLSGLYNRYRVISCGWRISSPTASYRQIGCIPSNDLSILWDINELKENPRARYVVQSVGGGTMTLSGKQYIPALMGRTKSQYMSDDSYSSVVTTSPSELALLYIVTATNAGVIEPGAQVQVLFEYTVEWFDIKRITQS